jgi:hypothetical protein
MTRCVRSPVRPVSTTGGSRGETSLRTWIGPGDSDLVAWRRRHERSSFGRAASGCATASGGTTGLARPGPPRRADARARDPRGTARPLGRGCTAIELTPLPAHPEPFCGRAVEWEDLIYEDRPRGHQGQLICEGNRRGAVFTWPYRHSAAESRLKDQPLVPLLGDSEVGWPAAGSPLIREPVAREHQGQLLFDCNPRGAVFHGHPAATRRVTR